MGYTPHGIGCVTVKAKAKMIIYGTPAHCSKGFFHHRQGSFVAGTMPVSQKKEQVQGFWELGISAKATMLRIKIC